jgi:O-antigen/teichoic acid export membrane protein
VKVQKKSELGLIVRNAGLDVFGQGFNIVFAFAASVVVTRTVGPEIFGKYSLANSIFQLLGILAVFGLSGGVVRLTSKYMALRDYGRVKGTAVSGVLFTTLFSLGLIALTLVAAPAVSRKLYSHVAGLDLVLRVYVIGLPFYAVMTILNGYTQGLKTLKPGVIVEMVVRPVARLALILILFLAGYRLFAVVLGSMGGFVCAAAAAFVFAIKASPFDLRRTPKTGVGQELFFYSLPLVLAQFMNVLISRSNVMISGHFLDSETVGVLSATLVLAPFVSMSLLSFSRILAPVISELWEKGDRAGLMRHFKIVSKWIFTLSLPVFCLYALFAPGLLGIFGGEFATGANALKVLAIGQIVNAIVGPIGFILTMTGRQKLNLVNSILVAASNIALNILLIPRYGIMGVAMATTLAITSINLLRVIQVKVLYGFTPFRHDLYKPLAAGAATTALFYLINRYLGWTGIPHTIALCIAFAAVYLVLLYGLGLAEEREVLKEILKRKQ